MIRLVWMYTTVTPFFQNVLKEVSAYAVENQVEYIRDGITMDTSSFKSCYRQLILLVTGMNYRYKSGTSMRAWISKLCVISYIFILLQRLDVFADRFQSLISITTIGI